MKKQTLILLILLISGALLLGSCAVSSVGGEGEVVVDIPDANEDGVPDGTVTATNGTFLVRVYLRSAENSLLQMTSGLMYEEAMAGESITVYNVPSGDWDVLLAYGEAYEGNFIAKRYGSSGLTFIAPGIENPVNITLKDSPIISAESLAGANISGVVSLGADIYIAAGQNVYKGPDAAGFALYKTLDAAATINSISTGIGFNSLPEVWINTSQGILSDTTGATISPTATNILYSAALLSGTDLLGFYQSTVGFGGAVLTLPAAAFTWHSVDNIENAFKAELVSNFVLTNDYFYCVTPFGAMIMAKTTYTNLNAKPGETMDVFADGSFFSVNEGGESLPILSLAYDSGSGVLYLGTAKGAYSATIGDAGKPTNPVIVSGTEGLMVSRVAANSGWAAFATPLSILILDRTAESLYELPFFAGVPGAVTDFTWKQGADNILLVAGADSALSAGGFITVDMADTAELVQIY